MHYQMSMSVLSFVVFDGHLCESRGSSVHDALILVLSRQLLRCHSAIVYSCDDILCRNFIFYFSGLTYLYHGRLWKLPPGWGLRWGLPSSGQRLPPYELGASHAWGLRGPVRGPAADAGVRGIRKLLAFSNNKHMNLNVPNKDARASPDCNLP